MIIYAGLITSENEIDGAEYFEGPHGDLYEFKYEVVLENDGDGFIRFSDSIGRMVPVDFSQIQDIAEMFGRIARFAAERTAVTEQLIDDLQNTNTWLRDEIRDITG